MARMIDIDDVERILWDHHFHDGDGLEALCDVAEILEAIRGNPGAVDIVRCKDCKHYMTIYCTCDGCCISPDWYCADGKKEEEE